MLASKTVGDLLRLRASDGQTGSNPPCLVCRAGHPIGPGDPSGVAVFRRRCVLSPRRRRSYCNVTSSQVTPVMSFFPQSRPGWRIHPSKSHAGMREQLGLIMHVDRLGSYANLPRSETGAPPSLKEVLRQAKPLSRREVVSCYCLPGSRVALPGIWNVLSSMSGLISIVWMVEVIEFFFVTKANPRGSPRATANGLVSMPSILKLCGNRMPFTHR
jgi:hypothetical protein